jgi:2-oxoglutarate dehydrogenase E2 component (dihydrolipoamide succinyltransferase)
MATNIVVPDLGGAASQAKLARWHKEIGATVHTGDLLLVLETQKATFEVNANAAGILTQITVPADANVKVGDTLGVIDEAAAR